MAYTLHWRLWTDAMHSTKPHQEPRTPLDSPTGGTTQGVFGAAVLFWAVACSAPGGGEVAPASPEATGGQATMVVPPRDDGPLDVGTPMVPPEMPTSGQELSIVETLPQGFTAASGSGGWNVPGSLAEVDFTAVSGCTNVLRGIARDFRHNHPDYNNDSLKDGLTVGMLDPSVNTDRKPVLVAPSPPNVTSAESFSEWYSNKEGTNLSFVLDLWLEPQGEKFVFDSESFFPLVAMGYANDCSGDNCWIDQQGFSFTTEFHTRFTYNGGEVFRFRGDDDVWVFLDGKLAVDLGGRHPALDAEIVLDEFAAANGLMLGQAYTLDMFHAERRFVHSNFRVETTLDFSTCGEILPVDIVK